MVNLNINVQKKDLWLLSAIVVFIAGVGFVIGFGDYSGNEAQINGHSSDEIMVKNSSGNLVSLQKLISGGLGNSLSCEIKTNPGQTGTNWKYVYCSSGYTLVSGHCVMDTYGCGYRVISKPTSGGDGWMCKEGCNGADQAYTVYAICCK